MLLENPGLRVLCTSNLPPNIEVAWNNFFSEFLRLFKKLRCLKTQSCCAAVSCLKGFLLPHNFIYVSNIYRNLCTYMSCDQ